MSILSAGGRWVMVNDALCNMLGYDRDEILHADLQSFVHKDDLSAAQANIRQLSRGKSDSFHMEKRYVRRNGESMWVSWNASRMSGGGGRKVYILSEVQDITDQKLAEERLTFDAFHDGLTGLPNRALFIEHLKRSLARDRRDFAHKFAVIFMDLDRFKVVNDSLGHIIGDKLLVAVSRKLEGCLRAGDSVARVGGDEFTILLEDLQDDAEVVPIVHRLQAELAAPLNIDGHEVVTTASMGIALSSPDYDDPEIILRDADTAMYHAKNGGKARYEIFDKDMHTHALNLLKIETDLKQAVKRREFFVMYQPIVELESFQLKGFEALVRWQHPEKGPVSPLDFIPIAEETGLITEIGYMALRESCNQMRNWHRLHPRDGTPLFISVNLSSKQFTQPNLLGQVKQVLDETELDPRSLKLEITESLLMENFESAVETLNQLRAQGIQLSIDDFGTGYSSLSYLHRLPIDTLKIDRSFISQIPSSQENIEIVHTILMLAGNLGMDVIAEGVETNEQLIVLRRLGCAHGQGYFFSKPLTFVGAGELIAETSNSRAFGAAPNIRYYSGFALSVK